MCPYCAWSSSEVGLEFEKQSGIYAQLAKLNNRSREAMIEGGIDPAMSNEVGVAYSTESTVSRYRTPMEGQYATLKSFYKDQLAAMAGAAPGVGPGEYGYGSPGALTRLLGLYTTGGYGSKKPKKEKTEMREANSDEGLSELEDETEVVERLKMEGWDNSESSTLLGVIRTYF